MARLLSGGAVERDAVIVAGFGFRGAATVDSLRSALALAGGAPDALAAPEDMADAPCLRELAEALRLPVLAVGPDALAAADTVTASARIRASRGTGSVAEAAALAAAGDGARLLGPRSVSEDRRAACAIASAGRR
jgi:cobalt-precorrin 5A hydrolase